MLDARKPAAAGVFYPADREVLGRTLRDLLDAASTARLPRGPRDRPVRAIVVPHGVIGAAGQVAASAWASVACPPTAAGAGGAVDRQKSRVGRVVLLGPAHYVRFAGIAAPFADAFATPLGTVEVDRLAIEAVRRFPQVVVSDVAHEQEPSLEVQLPFAQTVLGAAPIVPLAVGELSDDEATEVLEALWDETTLVVVSTDLSHYHDRAMARRLDEETARAIESLEARSIGEEQACGHAALRALLLVAGARAMRVTRLDLRQERAAAGSAGREEGPPTELDEVIGLGAFAVG